MEAQTRPFDRWATRIKVVLEIVAIPVVAYWAFTRFAAEDDPALEHRARITGAVTWQERSKEDCIAEYRIKFENIGKSSINLMGATVRAWLMKVPEAFGSIAYVDPTTLRGTPPLLEASLNNYLAHRYPPTVTDEVGLLFLVKRARGEMIVFLIEGQSEARRPFFRTEQHDWFDHQWDFVCGERPETAARN